VRPPEEVIKLKEERKDFFSRISSKNRYSSKVTPMEQRDNLMHGARSALNHYPDVREWCENFLKEKSRSENTQMSPEEFETYWKYHKPEIMHAGAAEAMAAWKENRKSEPPA